MDEFLSKISTDPSLREAVRTQLGLSSVSEDSPSHVRVTDTSPNSSGSSQLASELSQPVVYTSTSINQQSETADIPSSHQSDNSPLAARVRQFGAMIDPLAARVHQSGSDMNDPLAARVHQGEVNDAMNPNGGHRIEINNENSAGPPDFDPAHYTADDEYTFDAQSAITNYIEKHFRSTLDKTSRSAMHKEHPVPNTPATKAPKVDGFVTDYLKAAFPKSDDGELIKVQSALLKVCGPMACMWAELIDNNLLSDADATVNVHDVLNIIQRTIVLLGNANEMLSQLRRSKILAAVDTSLDKYEQKSQPESGEFLFGSEFTKYLRGEVETDSSLAEVVSLSRRHHPYNNALQSTIGRTKNQFFSRGSCQEVGSSAGQLSDPIKLPIASVTKRQFILQIKGEKPTLLGPTKEILDQLPQPRELLLCWAWI